MSLFSALVSGIIGIRATTTVPWGDASYEGFWGGYGGMQSASGMRVSPSTVKRISTALACVQKKSTAIAMLPCSVFTDDGSGGRKLAKEHPVHYLLHTRPNSLQTPFEFKQMLQSHVELRGNGYAEIIAGERGPYSELMPMHPDRVVVEQLAGSGRMRYRYNDPLTNTTRVLTQEEVFHIRENPDVVGVGQSRISAACDVYGVALAQQDYQARFMANDVTPGAYITGAQYKTVEEEDEFVDSLQRGRTGANRGRPYLLPPGVKMEVLSVKPIDAQLIEQTKLSDVRICAIHNVLPHLIGVDAGKSSTFASTEQFNLMHVQQCVLPMAIMWEEAIQRCLIGDEMFYAKFNLSSLMRGDDESQAAFFQTMASIGWMCADEGRALMDQGPIPDGSGGRFWNPTNWGQTNRSSAPPTTPSPGAAFDDEEEEDDQDESIDSTEEDDEQATAATLQMFAAIVAQNRKRSKLKKLRRAA